MSSYSYATLSICSFYAKGPSLEVVVIIFFFLWGHTIRKTNFPVLETSLLHCFAVIKEMVLGGYTSSILYNLVPKETIIAWGLDSYTVSHFRKYGCPSNTSQTSRGNMSHNTSSLKGLMLYGKWHCWLTWRSRPWWSHLMVYSFGCTMVSKPSCFMTSTKIWFFWFPLSTINCSG